MTHEILRHQFKDIAEAVNLFMHGLVYLWNFLIDAMGFVTVFREVGMIIIVVWKDLTGSRVEIGSVGVRLEAGM